MSTLSRPMLSPTRELSASRFPTSHDKVLQILEGRARRGADGVAAILVCAFFPAFSDFVLIASLYFLTASLLIGSSFLSEQRRVSDLNVAEDVNRRLRENRRGD